VLEVEAHLLVVAIANQSKMTEPVLQLITDCVNEILEIKEELKVRVEKREK
jgi:hypothetical protein